MSYNIPLRVAIGGSVDSSKSSLLGVLKTNKLIMVMVLRDIIFLIIHMKRNLVEHLVWHKELYI